MREVNSRAPPKGRSAAPQWPTDSFFLKTQFFSRKSELGCLSVVERLSLAQVVILASWDRVLHWGPPKKPASPSAYVSASL